MTSLKDSFKKYYKGYLEGWFIFIPLLLLILGFSLIWFYVNERLHVAYLFLGILMILLAFVAFKKKLYARIKW